MNAAFPRSFVIAMTIILALLTLVALGYLVLAILVPGYSPPSRASIVGIWVSPEGGKTEFSEDGRFVGDNISIPYSCHSTGVAKRGGRISGVGEWNLDTFPDETPGAKVDFKPRSDRLLAECPVRAIPVDESSKEIYLLHDDGMGERYRRKTVATVQNG
jgi:hypothetical protein